MTSENDQSSQVDRRTFLAAAGGVAVASSLLTTPAAAATRPGTIPVTVRQGTDMALAVSPDGRTIALDLLATVWTVGAAGGAATRLLPEDADATWPAFSADGRTVAFQSYADGGFQVWVAPTAGGRPRQLTSGRFDHREPVFTPNGQIVLASDRDGSTYGIYSLSPATGVVSVVVNSADQDEYHPAPAPNGQLAFVTAGTKIEVVNADGTDRRTLVTGTTGETLFAPAFSPDGTTVVYVSSVPGTTTLRAVPAAGGTPTDVSTAGEDVFPLRPGFFPDGRVAYTADGVVRTRKLPSGSATTIPFTAVAYANKPSYHARRPLRDDGIPRQVKGIVGPVLSPDGKQVAFRALNDLWIAPWGGQPANITNDRFFTTDPAWSPDGKTIAYATDRTGKPELWFYDIATRQHRQLTKAPGAAVLPAWAPDASRLAFIDENGTINLADAHTGAVTKVFGPLFAPGRPAFSKDGRTLAIAALRPNSRRFREGSSQILTIDLTTGTTAYREIMPDRSVSTRGLDGPVWSPDGKLFAFIVDGVLWVRPVDGQGVPTGPARQLTDVPTDAPSFAGDSTTISYLVGGELRKSTVDGHSGRSYTVPLRWRASKPSGRTVIHAGRFWDGVSDSVRENVDVVVDGDRIAAVTKHQPGRPAQHRIDASDATVAPGLIDMHNHRHLGGRLLGSRQGPLWLSLGVTTTRSPGDPAYDMVEEREATTTGKRLAPRYVGTGEAIDGRRIYYNFMRPTRDLPGVLRELERARLLDYDLVKNYVRLPVESQRTTIAWAHKRGIRASSHYLHPAVTLGVDGMEHVGATNRLGYSQTVSRNGISYQDVIALFTAAGLPMTPTLFYSYALYASDSSLFTDRRVKALFPPWEYAKLAAAVELAKSSDSNGAASALRGWTATVTAILRGGGRIVAGTDSPIDNFGVSLHENLRAMVHPGGLTPAEALRTATSQAADYLGVPDLGRLTPGALADLTVLTGNPLTRIEDAANVRLTMLGGVPHPVDELISYVPPTSPATMTTATTAVPEHSSQAEFWWHTEEFVRHAALCCSAPH